MSIVLPYQERTKERTSCRCALEARNLSIARGRRIVVRECNLTLAPGEIVLLLGANGAGKTTLLQCLAGLLRPAAGEIFWMGESAARTIAARRRIGFLSHESGLYLDLSLRENLLFAGRMCGVKDATRRAGELLAAAGLESKAAQPVHRLSQGMRKRLAIARAVIHEPLIMLLDEPFANLDEEYRRWLAGFLEALRDRGAAICLTSHDAHPCGAIAGRIVRLQGGVLIEADDSAATGLPLAAGA